ncbi:MAG: polyketide synthase, partial [Variovorax sp.]|nr:polyketide synthase [Variovorax sp.]
MSTSSMPRSEPIAIVGMGCRFPGGVMDPAGFWKLLREGGDAITEIPADRIDLGHYFDERAATAGRIMTRWGGFLQGIDEFDADFFGISPREAERLDPQQRLMLETAWEALEDAGLDTARLDGSNTAVFVGQWLSDFEARLFADAEGVDFYMTTGSGRYATSGRLSYMLGLRGPSLTLDTACSSSLAAVHLAVRSIRSGESDLAIAGGVNVILQPHISIAYSQSRMMAPDGHCKFGDAGGDGYVRSEGAGLVVLKSLQRALDDGDRIYAVIRGSAINNDGRSSGSMGTPSRVGQEELLRSAYRDAGVAPSRVGYVEAHGTGTRAGDPVELGALSAVLGDDRPPAHRAVVGSVKTNIGHTEGAAGVAGLIKAALALHHQHIPQSLHCKVLNPAIPWADMPVAVAQEAAPWPRGAEARVAGVSAFGIAGTNAHVVLEDAPAQPQAAVVSTRAHALLALSARSAAALKALAGRYADLLENAADAG